MPNNNKSNNSRRDFLKKVSFAIGSVAISGIVLKKIIKNPNEESLSMQESNEMIDNSKFKLLSKQDANNVIKNSNSSKTIKISPRAAPIKQGI